MDWVFFFAVVCAAVVIRIVQSRMRARRLRCPRCDSAPATRLFGGRTSKQMFWGGWKCPNCRCDVDRHGAERPAGELGPHDNLRDAFRDGLLHGHHGTFVRKPWLATALFTGIGVGSGFLAGVHEKAASGRRACPQQRCPWRVRRRNHWISRRSSVRNSLTQNPTLADGPGGECGNLTRTH